MYAYTCLPCPTNAKSKKTIKAKTMRIKLRNVSPNSGVKGQRSEGLGLIMGFSILRAVAWFSHKRVRPRLRLRFRFFGG